MGVVCSSAKQEEWKKNNSYVAMNKSAEKVGGYNTQEGKCELIGFRYSEKIDHKEITLDKAIKDIVEYTRWYNKQDSRHAQYCWLSLHLALGLCFQYKVSDKEMVRNLLAELLPYSRGIDMGLFMRDLLHYEDISQQNAQLEKTYYFLSFCAGFIVNLEKNGLGDEIFKGPARVEYRDLLRAGECAYLDIPIGHPTVLLTETDNHTGDQCINIACENLKPNVVLVLLQHGKSPFGAIERLLDTLGAVNVVGRTQQQIMVIEAPVEIVVSCLEMCLRAVKKLSLCFDGQTFADLKDKSKQGVMYVNEEAKKYIPEHFYTSPCPLKQNCRCEIRNLLQQNAKLPSGISQLSTLSDDMRKYVDLLC